MTRFNLSIGAWLALAAALIMSTSPPADGAAGGGTGSRYSYSFGGQQPPPSHVQPFFDDFVPIYGGYKVLDDGESAPKPTFVEWCVMCGVRDARTLMAMHVLHTWAERVNFDPRRYRRR